MERTFIRIFSFLLTFVMVSAYFPADVLCTCGDTVYADYSVSPEYAERYPAGVIRFYDSGVTVAEGCETTLKLIRTGGTRGKVSVELKAIDVTAKFGVDYTVEVQRKKLVQSESYTGTINEMYLEQIGEDFITADTMFTDEVYKTIIGYEEEEQNLSDEDAGLLHDASVALVSDKLGVSVEEAEKLVDLSESGNGTETDTESDAAGNYKSKMHELKDSILNEKTAPNSMVTSDLLGVDSLIGDNKENLVSSTVYAEAAGASLRVVFADGENEKTIVIKALKDGEYEPQEVASLGICNPEGGVELGRRRFSYSVPSKSRNRLPLL